LLDQTSLGGHRSERCFVDVASLFVLWGMFYCCCVINLMAGKCEQPEAGAEVEAETEAEAMCIGIVL